MPVNRNALIRYKTIDKCLQNRYRKWTLNDLIDACSDALYEYEGIAKGVSRRTVQGDIQMMRSDKLGYNAPIVVMERKYYTYEEPDYSITNVPLTNQDLEQMVEAVSLLKQFKEFSHFSKLEGMIQKLEEHIYSEQEKRPPIIDFEKNELLKGLHYLEDIYQAILKQQIIELSYKSFKARMPQVFKFHAYLLKEYNNRWFVVGKREDNAGILNLALDRIVAFELLDDLYPLPKNFDGQAYFKDVIGVTVNPNQSPQEVLLQVSHRNAPYILTKPIHPSQREVERNNEGVVISLNVQMNYELEREILGYGEWIKVLAPVVLRNKIQKRLKESLDVYDTEITGKGAERVARKLRAKGVVHLDHLYSLKMFNQIRMAVDRHMLKDFSYKKPFLDINPYLESMPHFKNLLFNNNLQYLLSRICPGNVYLQGRLVFLNRLESTQLDWHQQKKCYVGKEPKDQGVKLEKVIDQGFLMNLPESILKEMLVIHLSLSNQIPKMGMWHFLAGSQKKMFTQEEIKLLSHNTIGQSQELSAGNALVFRPLILKKFVRKNTQKNLQVLELIFSPPLNYQ